VSELILKRKRAQREHQTAQVEVQAAGTNIERIRRGHEALGAARAQTELLESVARDYERRARSKEDIAAERRKQIEELRAQLKRYSEALENDLQTGRERIANRVREALAYERAFGEASNLLLDHLRDKPECRELLEDIDKRRNGEDPDDKPSELQELMERHAAAQ
jgi:eukaryotic-like serine/threonine-protein kinase